MPMSPEQERQISETHDTVIELRTILCGPNGVIAQSRKNTEDIEDLRSWRTGLKGKVAGISAAIAVLGGAFGSKLHSIIAGVSGPPSGGGH